VGLEKRLNYEKQAVHAIISISYLLMSCMSFVLFVVHHTPALPVLSKTQGLALSKTLDRRGITS
jgi:hypothetical protein